MKPNKHTRRDPRAGEGANIRPLYIRAGRQALALDARFLPRRVARAIAGRAVRKAS